MTMYANTTQCTSSTNVYPVYITYVLYNVSHNTYVSLAAHIYPYTHVQSHKTKCLNKPAIYCACLTQVTAQVVALHVVLPTALPGALYLCASLPAPPSAMCVGGCQSQFHGQAIFPLVAAYMIPHLSYYG